MSFFRPSNRLAIPLYGTIRCIFISQQRPAFFYSSWVNSIKRQAVERKDLSFSLIQSRRVESDSSAILTALIKENCYVTKGVPSLKNLKVFTFFGIISVTTALNSFGNVAYCVDLNQGTGSVNHLFASASTAASSTPTNPPYHDAPELTVPTNGNEGNQPNFASKMTKIMLGTTMGFVSGYFVKKVTKLAVLTISAAFFLIPFMRAQGYEIPQINWGIFDQTYNLILQSDRDETGSPRDFRNVINFLKRTFQTNTAFVIGFGLGLKIG